MFALIYFKYKLICLKLVSFTMMWIKDLAKSIKKIGKTNTKRSRCREKGERSLTKRSLSLIMSGVLPVGGRDLRGPCPAERVCILRWVTCSLVG